MVLTTYETDQDFLRAVEAGATGYLIKDIAPNDLASAVRAAARGETVLAPSAQGALLHRFRQPTASTPSRSAREIVVLWHAADGRTNAAIGTAMHIGDTTVKTDLARAFDKLGVSDRTSAVRRAIDLGLIRSPRNGHRRPPRPPGEPRRAPRPSSGAPPAQESR